MIVDRWVPIFVTFLIARDCGCQDAAHEQAVMKNESVCGRRSDSAYVRKSPFFFWKLFQALRQRSFSHHPSQSRHQTSSSSPTYLSTHNKTRSLQNICHEVHCRRSRPGSGRRLCPHRQAIIRRSHAALRRGVRANGGRGKDEPQDRLGFSQSCYYG